MHATDEPRIRLEGVSKLYDESSGKLMLAAKVAK